VFSYLILRPGLDAKYSKSIREVPCFLEKLHFKYFEVFGHPKIRRFRNHGFPNTEFFRSIEERGLDLSLFSKKCGFTNTEVSLFASTIVLEYFGLTKIDLPN
jgi:hypothetical protein